MEARMTPEEWANTVGLNWHHHEQPVSLYATPDWPKNGVAIAAAIRAAVTEEREACAKIAERIGAVHLGPNDVDTMAYLTAKDIVAAIRRRGEGQP